MAIKLPDTYWDILEVLKAKIREARIKAVVTANVQLLAMYWEIGQAIAEQEEQQGWGAKIVEQLARDLKTEFPDFKGLSARNLRYMRDFALSWPELKMLQQAAATLDISQILQQAAAKLPWFHICTLIDKVKTNEERRFYATKAIENGWSRNVLIHQIESNLFLRQGKAITNFELTLPKPQSDLARETFKNPYLFDFLGIGDEMQERELEKALIQHIKKFILELGRGFAYVGNQYNLRVEEDEYFLDLLFYNYQLDCFVVFELKVGEFKPEFAGKLNFYINTIDAQIKLAHHKPTIGVLLCKTPNETVVQYALKGINTPMGVSEYEFTTALPKQLKGEIPTIEELEQEIEKEVIEFKENLNPVDARLQAIKEKLKGIKTDEIQTPATYQILMSLFQNGLKPLYYLIIEKMKIFEDEFYDKMYVWNAANKAIVNLEQLEEFWKDEKELRKNHFIAFNYNLFGFKKAGTENFDEYLQLNFEINTYWYGFTLVNHNNQQPFLKKLYHQQFTDADQQQIIDLLMTKVMDRIEWILEFMKKKEEKQQTT